MPMTGSQLAASVAEKTVAVSTADAAVLAAQAASARADSDLANAESLLVTLVTASPFYVVAEDGTIKIYEPSAKSPGYVITSVANGDSVSLPDSE